MPNLSKKTRRFVSLFLIFLLLLAQIFTPQKGYAQIVPGQIPYNWVSDKASAEADDDGCILGTKYCRSPQARCKSYYNDYEKYPNNTVSNVEMKVVSYPGHTPYWECSFDVTFPYANTTVTESKTDGIRQLCGGDYPGYDIYVSHGCRVGKRKNLGKCESSTGNPMTICSGNKYEEYTDYAGGGLFFTRSYNSLSRLPDTGLGLGWRHNFSRKLSIDSTITAVRADGREITFNGTTYAKSDKDIFETLSYNSTAGIYTLSTPNDTKEIYNTSGQLTQIQYEGGYTQTLAYTSDNLISVTDSFGRSLTFTYDGSGLMQSMTTPNGDVYKYAYALMYPSTPTLKKLVKVTQPDSTISTTDNPVIEYIYDEANDPLALIGIKDPLGNRYATWSYDDKGRVQTSEHAGGVDTASVDFTDSTTRVTTDENGQKVRYTFALIENGAKLTKQERLAADGVTVQATRTYSHDTSGFLAQLTDWDGTVTQYTNDTTRGLQTQRIEAYGTAQARSISTTWHSTFRVPTQITEPNRTTSFTYDSSGNMLTRTVTDTTVTPNVSRTWTYTYDSFGRILTQTTPLSHTTTFTYGASNPKNLTTVTNAKGYSTTINSYNANGLPTQITDANDLITTLAYDNLGRVTTVTQGGTAINSIAYNKAGLVTSITLAGNRGTLNYTYDDAHRLTKVTDGAGNYVAYTLDNAGNITQAQIKSPTNTLLAQIQYVYDTLGRLTTLKVMQDNSTMVTGQTFAYDAMGNLVNQKDGLNNETINTFDALGRVTSTKNALNQTATFTYNSDDNLLTATEPRNVHTNDPMVTTYTYNGFGDVLTETNPNIGTLTYTYDGEGNVLTKTDARGITAEYTYDVLNRVFKEKFKDNTNTYQTSEEITYTYDSILGINKGRGKLTKAIDESGTTEFTYDILGNLITRTNTVGGQVYTTSYTYDAGGLLTKITYPSGHIVNYSYDTNTGRVNSVTYQETAVSTPVNIATNIQYRPFGGPLVKMDYGNGLTVNTVVDKQYRVSRILTYLTATLATERQNMDVEYDLAGNITSLTDEKAASNHIQSFTYNALNYLTKDEFANLSTPSTVTKTLGYAYDANGNRTTASVDGVASTYAYINGKNRLASVTPSGGTARSFSNDNLGNRLTDNKGTTATTDDATYTYSARGQMKTATVGSTTATYSHNAFGERIVKSLSSGALFHYQYHDGRILSEISGTTGLYSREFIWLDGLPIAQIKRTSGGSVLYWIHSDFMGTPRLATNASGSTVWQRTQDPFGNQEFVNDVDSAYTNIRFDGQYFDSLTGLHYNLNRDYDPTIGRYTQSDPIGIIGGLNRYGYTPNNPLRYTDPDGNQAIAPTAPAGFGSALGGYAGQAGAAAARAAASLGALVGPATFYFWPNPAGEDDRMVQEMNERERKIRSGEYCPVDGGAQGATTSGNSPNNNNEDPKDDCKTGPLRASDLVKNALDKGWTRSQSSTGPLKFFDENGKERLTIKKGSPRTPGSEGPHAAFRDAQGKRIDVNGRPTTQTSPCNHTPIIYDLF